MSSAALIFPHQLFSSHPVLRFKPERVFLIEDPLFFGDRQFPARFHKQKLAFHRATMAAYAKKFETLKASLTYIEYCKGECQLDVIVESLAAEGVERLLVADVHDWSLQRRLTQAVESTSIVLEVVGTPMFINEPGQNRDWREGRKRWFMADYYQWQRQRLDILMDEGKPAGGKWSYDEENRRKIPKRALDDIPALPQVGSDATVEQAIESVEADFADNPGSLEQWYYPTTHQAAERWLECFLNERFANFGVYEDALVEGQSWLYHSVLTPALNVGLLTPQQVVDRALEVAGTNDIPLNSVEGFVRQIIGWREFMRATYDDLGVAMRTTNHWNHTRALPASFYTGTTGVDPIDDVIKRVLETGYCHHIERLMVLGGFMFLCEIDPDDIYRWFMEMFIDSYDWVMVPNVYAMSQHADGGAITTKPYFSGSNYVLKMSNYGRGEWCEIWDGLFWRWIWKHRKALGSNPRWAMMCRNVEKMDEARRQQHLCTAEAFLDALHA